MCRSYAKRVCFCSFVDGISYHFPTYRYNLSRRWMFRYITCASIKLVYYIICTIILYSTIKYCCQPTSIFLCTIVKLGTKYSLSTPYTIMSVMWSKLSTTYSHRLILLRHQLTNSSPFRPAYFVVFIFVVFMLPPQSYTTFTCCQRNSCEFVTVHTYNNTLRKKSSSNVSKTFLSFYKKNTIIKYL